jgi:subtilase family serine protease
VIFAAATAAAVAPAGAAGSRPLLSGLVAFGCGNPANQLSATLLPSVLGNSRNATCFGKARTWAGQAGPAMTNGPVGLTPSDIRSAYHLSGGTTGRLVAVVDAFDDPNAEADLAVYRAHFGLPACTHTNGCFTKVNQSGKAGPLPRRDAGWGMEISLDLDAVSATCPRCPILLVEARSAADTDLMAAVDTAVAKGAVAVSNSYGGAEDPTILGMDRHLNHRGVAITASSGDDGYGVSWPASSPYVTSVGGTSLRKASNARGWTETAWSGSGSGCSAFEAKPSWQRGFGCSRRTVADVSAVADPATGLAIYDTYASCGRSTLCDVLVSLGLAQGLRGWAQVGGTSLSSPIIASVYALAGNKVTAGAYPYTHRSALNDVTRGSNGSCGGSYLCTARTGYDGPTGLGTPKGTAAF